MGYHRFQIGVADADPGSTPTQTDVFTVSASGLMVVRTGIAAGPVKVGLAMHAIAPPADLASWDNVAETTVTATQDLSVMSVDGDVYDDELGRIPVSGTVAIRVSVRGRAANWDGVVAKHARST